MLHSFDFEFVLFIKKRQWIDHTSSIQTVASTSGNQMTNSNLSVQQHHQLQLQHQQQIQSQQHQQIRLQQRQVQQVVKDKTFQLIGLVDS